VSDSPEDLHALDCHSHIAPDVTSDQLVTLGDSQILAMTRSLEEAEYVSRRTDPNLIWGCGVHPGVRNVAPFQADVFGRLIQRFAVVGEVGLDARGGPDQGRVLEAVLRITASEPVLVSLHSTGRVKQVLDMLEAFPQRGAILHWFLADGGQVDRAVRLGCYFSANAAMSDDQLRQIPADRLLPETDFPSSRRRTGASLPGDTRVLEDRLCSLLEMERTELRHGFYRNLRAISLSSGAIERLPDHLAEHLLAA
jgi:TatD DNase family protein